ncbi:MAG: DUF5329 domain-containing protein [Desulfofustis sp.]|nr:DUF5329 domain-containing protein [Desulfofustis sp.]
MLPLLVGCWLLFVPTEAAADALDRHAAAEIDHLLKHIKTSPCRFNRNGDWYEAAAAAEHIDRKYRYLLRHDRIDSAEDFIGQAAATSSISGKEYLVQCPTGDVLTTADWLTVILAELRHRESPDRRSPPTLKGSAPGR